MWITHLGVYCHRLEKEQKEIVTEKLVIKKQRNKHDHDLKNNKTKET